MSDSYVEWLDGRIEVAEKNLNEAKRKSDHNGVIEYQTRADAFKRAKIEYVGATGP